MYFAIMKVRAIHFGQRIDLRKLQGSIGLRISFREPLVVEFAKNKFVSFFRYGVVVFWNLGDGEINEVLLKINPFIVEPFQKTVEEAMIVKTGKQKDEIKNEHIFISDLRVEKVAIMSIVLSRSLVLDYFEREVGKVMNDIGVVINSFALKGKPSFSSRELLKKVGVAMRIKHVAVNQMAMLDKPDLIWEDKVLDALYSEIAEEYELDERYEILNDKLKMLFTSIEFILSYIDGRRSLFLEITIVFLIVFEIVIFLIEQFSK